MLGTCFPNNKKSYACRWEDGILVVFLKRKKCHINTAEASFQIAGKQIVLAKY